MRIAPCIVPADGLLRTGRGRWRQWPIVCTTVGVDSELKMRPTVGRLLSRLTVRVPEGRLAAASGSVRSGFPHRGTVGLPVCPALIVALLGWHSRTRVRHGDGAGRIGFDACGGLRWRRWLSGTALGDSAEAAQQPAVSLGLTRNWRARLA